MSIKPRIRLPESARVGEVIEVRTLISHVMETGQRKGVDGQTIARDIVHTFAAQYAGKEFFKAALHPGTSANPYLAFFFRVPGPGEFEFTWLDDAGTQVVEKTKLVVVG